jgi:hypothetical protein
MAHFDFSMNPSNSGRRTKNYSWDKNIYAIYYRSYYQICLCDALDSTVIWRAHCCDDHTYACCRSMIYSPTIAHTNLESSKPLRLYSNQKISPNIVNFWCTTKRTNWIEAHIWTSRTGSRVCQAPRHTCLRPLLTHTSRLYEGPFVQMIVTYLNADR